MGYNFFNLQPVKETLELKLCEFISSLGGSVSRGEDITFADNDITYTLKLQNDRIKEKGLEMEYEVYKRKEGQQYFIAASNWQDSHYESTVAFRPCGVKRTVKKGGRKVYKDHKKSVIYETVTDVITGSHPDNDLICCPNCGAVETIATLQNGCSYCGTRYKMDDLFPKVTGYYFLDDPGIDKSDFRLAFFISWLLSSIFLFLVSVGALIFNPDRSFSGIVFAFIGSPIIGIILGYFNLSIFLLLRLIIRGISTSGKMGTAGSRRKFEAIMKKISPEFSFEYFTSKAISLVKTAIYAKDEQELLFYEGEPLSKDMKDIIDLNYGGALGLERFKEEDGIVTVVTDAFFDVLYAKDNKIKYKHQVFSATFKRRTDIPVNFNFSMTRIQCPTCGASFDATKNKFCPSCGHEYEIISDDWVLTEVTLI